MQTITTIGLDIAKSVFQVHGVDAAGQVVTHSGGIRRFPVLAKCPRFWAAFRALLGRPSVSTD